MNVRELIEILEWLDGDLEIVKEDMEGKEPVTIVSLFKNNRGETKAIIE